MSACVLDYTSCVVLELRCKGQVHRTTHVSSTPLLY